MNVIIEGLIPLPAPTGLQQVGVLVLIVTVEMINDRYQYTRMAHWPNITPPDIPDHGSPQLSTDFLVEFLPSSRLAE